VTQLYALVFARCAGFVFRAPGFSHPAVPPMVRAGLALVLAIGLSPALHDPATLPAGSFVFALALEVALGAMVGMAASILYDGVSAGARALDDYVGIQDTLRNATNPAGGEAFSRLWTITFIAAFFVLGGYRLLIVAFAHGLELLPPGSLLRPGHLFDFAQSLPSLSIRAALIVAGPGILLGLLAQLALGSVARVIPRFSNFTLTFPIVFGVVLMATLATLPFAADLAGRPWLHVPMLNP
jgi:flagellar biosynthetic protein FliR